MGSDPGPSGLEARVRRLLRSRLSGGFLTLLFEVFVPGEAVAGALSLIEWTDSMTKIRACHSSELSPRVVALTMNSRFGSQSGHEGEKKMSSDFQNEKDAENFAQLLAQVLSGSESAERTLVETYAPHVLRVVRRSLHRDLRAKFDSEDFVQQVWKSLFSEREALEGIDRPEILIAYLAAMARNKVVEEFRRRLQTAKHNIRREVSLGDSRHNFAGQVASPDPTPSQNAVAHEKWEQLTSGLSDLHREIVRMRLEGSTCRSISVALKIHERTVRRVLKQIDVA